MYLGIREKLGNKWYNSEVPTDLGTLSAESQVIVR